MSKAGFTAVAWTWDYSDHPDLESIKIETAKQMDGSIKYAVRHTGCCLTVDGKWEFEPTPSSRDDAFLNRCRFDTWQQAADTIVAKCTWIDDGKHLPSSGTRGKTMQNQTTLSSAPVHGIVTLPSCQLPLDTIICGDNCEVMRTLPSESIDLVVTSPPYDDLRTYGGHSWDFYGVAWNLKRLLKPGGVIVWNVADATIDGSETLTSMKQALHFKEMGFNVHDTMIYAKTSFSNPYPNRYHQVWEYVFILSVGAPKTFNPIEDRKNKNAGCVVSLTVREADGSLSKRSPKLIAENGKRFNVWEMDTAKHDGAVFKHPAIFPEALARDHILSWSNEGDVVLDPFSGSGTTAKMAKYNGRRFIGIEVNPEYVEISQQRLAQGVLF